MFTLSELKQPRVYQDSRLEDELKKAHSLFLRILTRPFSKLSDPLTPSIQSLEITKLITKCLDNRLLDFKTLLDLECRSRRVA